jgi:hypothetical protein
MIFSKNPTAKEWMLTSVDYKPSITQDKDEEKVSLTLSSPDYEIKAVSRNLKCAILYRYETDNEELSLVDFGTGPSATIKTNVLGKASNVNIANVVLATAKF